MHVEWAVNEKVALEIAYTAAIAGLRAAVSMKQVGLNVASDPLLSAAYLGVTGGFVVVSADDPGPHSSQTEQDSRLLAMMAKVPVLDPASPAQAMALAGPDSTSRRRSRSRNAAADNARLPREPGRRRGSVPAAGPGGPVREGSGPLGGDPRVPQEAARPSRRKDRGDRGVARDRPIRVNPEVSPAKAVVASGVAFAHAKELFGELGISDRIALYQVIQPYPLHAAFIDHLLETYAEILVLEESAPVIEMQVADRGRVRGG